MPKNLGRSVIRNVLGKAAKYPYLLFMDCDSKVVSNDYIEKYMAQLQPGSLLYGGRCYNNQAPKEKQYLLHWKYGKNREESSAKERFTHPWHSFMTNNFVVPRNIFLNTLFDEGLKQYGHEDTIFGLELKKQNTKIIHLDNPLEHIGLESSQVFIKKSEQALENLYFLHQKNPLMETKLLNLFSSLKRKKIIPQIGKQYYFLSPFIIKQLHSKFPSLKLFDFYKLLFLSHLDLKQHNLIFNNG